MKSRLSQAPRAGGQGYAVQYSAEGDGLLRRPGAEVGPAALNTEEATLFNKQIEAEFVNSLEQDIFGALIDGLKTNHDLVISQKAIDAAIARFN